VRAWRRFRAFVEADVGAPIASWRFWCPIVVDQTEADGHDGHITYTIRLNLVGLIVPFLVSLGYVIITQELR
jgi:hypothetical protein